MKWAENCSGIEEEEEVEEADLGEDESEGSAALMMGKAELSISMDPRPRWRSVLPRTDLDLLATVLGLALPRCRCPPMEDALVVASLCSAWSGPGVPVRDISSAWVAARLVQ